MYVVDNKSPYWFVLESYCKRNFAQDEYWQAGLLSDSPTKAVIRIFVDGPECYVIDLTVGKRAKRKV